MRNLKRVLSLALACALVIGMMVVGTSAADFADASEIKYTEAVEVMSALEVLEGDGTNFNPKDILTREQAAKIICYMLLGPENAEMLPAVSTFSDVYASHWSAPYISYCASMDIIAGNGDGTFNPNGKLTGVAFAKMLLVALGYDAKIEGYVNNTNWSTNIGSDALDVKLNIKGVDLAAEVTREQAAQMALNTLEATMVKYATKGTSVTVNGVDIVTGAAEAEPRTYIEDGGRDYTTGGDTALEGDTIQFCEKYFEDLRQDASLNVGVLGTPGYTWFVKGDYVTFAEAEPVATFNGFLPGKLVANMLKGYSIADSSDVVRKINNTLVVADFEGAAIVRDNGEVDGNVETFNSPIPGNTTIAEEIAYGLLANGKQVKFYDVNRDMTVDAITTTTYTLGQVLAVAPGKSNGSSFMDYTVMPVGGGAPVTKRVWTNAVNDEKDTAVVAGNVQDKDFVTYVVGAAGTAGTTDDMLFIFPTTVFQGAQSKINAKTSTLTIDGKEYGAASGLSNVAADTDTFPNSVENANYFVDQFGYVVMTTAIENIKYAIVDKIALINSVGTGSNQSVEADLVMADGSIETVKVSKINGFETKNCGTSLTVTTDADGKITAMGLSDAVDDNLPMAGQIVKYALDSKGNYELNYLNLKADQAGAPDAAFFANGDTTTDASGGDETQITVNGMPYVMGYNGGATAIKGDKDTVYVVKTPTSVENVFDFTSYTGYEKVPTIAADDASVWVTFAVNPKMDNHVDLVYIDASDENVDTGTTKAGDMAYFVTNAVTERLDKDGLTKYYEVTGIVNGVAGVTLTTKDEELFQPLPAGLTEGVLYELTRDADGYVTEVEEITENDFTQAYNVHNTITAPDERPSKGVLAVDGKGYTYNGSETVYVIDDEGNVSRAVIDAIGGGDTIYVEVVDREADDAEQFAIKTVYIVKP